MKWSIPNEQYASIDFDHQSELNSLEPPINVGSSSFKRQGSRTTKKEQNKLKFIDFIVWIHAQAIIDMATTTLKKAIIMEEQSIMALFIVLDFKLVKVKEHFMLQRRK